MKGLIAYKLYKKIKNKIQMGSLCYSKEPIDYQQQSRKIKEKYQFLHFIGEGSYGKVQLIENRRDKRKYAMKIFDKVKAFNEKCVKEIIRERKIVQQNHHEFLIKLVEAFQDKEKLYLVMNYMPYGSLRELIVSKKTFTEDETRFIITCILIGLENMREQNIVHRDIKPENILIDDQKYFCIGDFSSSNYLGKFKGEKRMGTNGYMSPEMINKHPEDFTTDYYSLGIIAKELILGNKKMTLPNIDQQKSQKMEREKSVMSAELIDLIQRLTEEDSKMRIGKVSLSEIWTHPWLRMNTVKKGEFLLKKHEINPFKDLKFRRISEISKKKCIHSEKSDEVMANMLLLQSDNIQRLFTDYEYFQEELAKTA